MAPGEEENRAPPSGARAEPFVSAVLSTRGFSVPVKGETI